MQESAKSIRRQKNTHTKIISCQAFCGCFSHARISCESEIFPIDTIITSVSFDIVTLATLKRRWKWHICRTAANPIKQARSIHITRRIHIAQEKRWKKHRQILRSLSRKKSFSHHLWPINSLCLVMLHGIRFSEMHASFASIKVIEKNTNTQTHAHKKNIL